MRNTPKIQCSLDLAREYREEIVHLEQVARLSSMLFHALWKAHRLTETDEELLLCGALLHDIGIRVAYAQHHKHSLDLIQKSELIALTDFEKDVVSLLARYHRKAPPKRKHGRFAALPLNTQEKVKKMAGILRIADGLDRSHENAVQCIDAIQKARTFWRIKLQGDGDLHYAAWGGQRKAALLEESLGVIIKIGL